jgi:hypothetical protein
MTPDFDLANHVLPHSAARGRHDGQGMDAAIELNEPIPRSIASVMEGCTSFPGVPERTLILQMTHHAMIDGASGIEVDDGSCTTSMRKARIPSRRRRNRGVAQPPADRRANSSRARCATTWNGCGGSRPAVRDPERREPAGPLLRKAFGVFFALHVAARGDGAVNAGVVGPHRKLRWMKRPLSEIREIRPQLGGTINDVVLTVVSEAVARYLSEHGERVDGAHLRIMCPVNVRTEGSRARSAIRCRRSSRCCRRGR